MTKTDIEALKILTTYGEWSVFETYIKELRESTRSVQSIDKTFGNDSIVAQVFARQLVDEILDTAMQSMNNLKRQMDKPVQPPQQDKYE